MKRKIASFLVVVVAVVACSGERIAKHRGGGDEGAQAGESSQPDAGGSTNAGGSTGAGGSAGTGGSTNAGGSGGSAGTIGSAATSGFAGAGSSEPWISIDASDCEERAEGDCTGMNGYYYSNEQFADTPALSECSMFVSYDGCGEVSFDFDANGCAVGVGPEPEDWDRDDHLGDLRECMREVFARGRFACLSSRRLSFQESCFIN